MSSQLSTRSIFDSNANLYTTYTVNGAFIVSKKENKTTKVAWFELLSILKGCAVRMYNMAVRVVEFSSRGYKIRTPHGWVKSTVIERRQQQLGRMTDFPPPVTFSVFYL